MLKKKPLLNMFIWTWTTTLLGPFRYSIHSISKIVFNSGSGEFIHKEESELAY
jgi:hypothetical protein